MQRRQHSDKLSTRAPETTSKNVIVRRPNGDGGGLAAAPLERQKATTDAGLKTGFQSSAGVSGASPATRRASCHVMYDDVNYVTTSRNNSLLSNSRQSPPPSAQSTPAPALLSSSITRHSKRLPAAASATYQRLQ